MYAQNTKAGIFMKEEAATYCQARAEDFKRGGGEIFNVVVCNATRPEGMCPSPGPYPYTISALRASLRWTQQHSKYRPPFGISLTAPAQ